MMEAAGLALGIVALAGLFSTCIELFDIIDTSQNYHTDSGILLTRFEVEKTRFLIWGKAVGILEPFDTHRDPQLASLEIRATIKNVLTCLHCMFTDIEKLRAKYGLDQAENVLSPLKERRNDVEYISKNAMTRFRAKVSPSRNTRWETSFIKTLRWAVRDCKKFRAMISDLRELVDSLECLVPHTQIQRQELIQTEIDALPEESLSIAREAYDTNWSDVISLHQDHSKVTNWLERSAVHVPDEHVSIGTTLYNHV